MTAPIRLSIVMAALMCIASALVFAARPSGLSTGPQTPPHYEKIVPDAFGDWAAEKRLVGGIVNPQQEALLNQLYSETVSRLYVNRRTGERIMLSLAYGEDQSKQNQVHRPEVCYPAQGFQIAERRIGHLSLGDAQLPVLRLVAKAGSRNEPITYWIRIGDSVVAGYLDQKLEAVKRRLSGQSADGLLFRVSSISGDANSAFETQERFVSQFLSAITPQQRALFVGRAERT